MGNARHVTHQAVAAGGAGTRAAGADRRNRVLPHLASTLASLRTNDRPETYDPKLVAAWTQLPLGVPVDHVPHCHVGVAPAAATGGRGDQSGGR